MTPSNAGPADRAQNRASAVLLDPARIRTVLCDLDGVVWLAHQPIPGSVEAIESIRAGGRRVVFVTNNSAARITDHVAALERIGVPAVGDVISSAIAAADLISEGERVLVTGGAGIVEAVERRGGVVVVNDGGNGVTDVDVVIVGLHRDFDYRRLSVAAAAVQSGARLIGTNTDPTYPTPRGPEPGGGSILAAVATASETEPVIAGKPHPTMAAAIKKMLSDDGPFDARSVIMVGDRPDTDGLMAAAIGCRFVLVRTGVTLPGVAVAEVSDMAGMVDVDDLAALAASLGDV